MLGELQQKKIERLFNVLDSDRNGLLEQGDFAKRASVLTTIRGENTDSPLYQKLYATQMAWWENLRAATDKDNNGQVTLEEWSAFWEAWLTSVANEAATGQTPSLEAIKGSAAVTFDMIDSNQDGQVTSDEYASWFQTLNLGGDGKNHFNRLDLDGDGIVSRDEAIKLSLEFFLSNEPEAPGNYLYGSLS
uniref:Calcium-binding EF-hand-containing protein n=1 Tax=Cyanothece sp. (strain PCC 7425 / ATCC 29141) TaxID=395961 RepID=B8HL04_CYAP4